MISFIISLVVIVLLVVVMSLILKNTVKQVDEKSKSYFVDKLKEYDSLIDEKEKKLSDLNEELEKKKQGLKDNKEKNEKAGYDFDNSIINLLTETNYSDKSIFAINKKIEEKFIINYEDLIKDFLANTNDNNGFDFCVKLRSKFTPEEIYKVETMLPDDRDNYLKENLSSDEYKLYRAYLSSNRFDMDGFIDYLNHLIELNSPIVRILVPNKNINYDYIDNRIKTEVNGNIYRGIKIIYKNKVYDFSLNEGNVWDGA